MYWSSSDLSLSGQGVVTSGGKLSYALTLGNGGPQTATSVVLTAVLPAGVSLVSASGMNGSNPLSCTQAAQTVSCSVGTLAQSSAATLTIVLDPGSAQTVSISFTAQSAHGDLDPANNTVNASLALASGAASDGPLPFWANLLLGMLLLAVATWRMRTHGAAHTRA
jgi:uncharacterized repeat protein (TIGR01451 family)